MSSEQVDNEMILIVLKGPYAMTL